MKAKLAWVLLVAAVVLAGTGSPITAEDHPSTAISDIRQETTERSTRLVVECTGPLAYTYYSPDPLTLVVDIPEVDASKVPQKVSVGSREVESVRVTSMARADGRSLARLEVRLASLGPYQIYSKGKALNLIFERPANARPAEAPAPATTSVAEAPAPKPVAPAPAPAVAAAPAAAPAPVEPTPDPAPIAVAEAPTVITPSQSAPTQGATLVAGPKATKIVSVVQQEEGGQVAVTVKADGRLRYQDFFLGNPDRLVVDFADVLSKAQTRTLDVNSNPVKKVRLGQFSAASPRVARLVMDLSARAPYRIVEGSDGVKILFTDGAAAAPEPLAALRPAVAPGPAPAPMLVLPEPAPALNLPALPEPQAPVTQGALDQAVPPEEKKYTGAPISLDFKDGDLQDIFRLFADISGSNVVINPGVSGKVTLKLTEVPWDQALDLILKTNGLGSTVENNVIRIARLSDLQREEQERRKLAEEKALAGDLEVVRKRLSYAKAAELEATVKKVALSARGNITLDPRTNTMIITDLPDNIRAAHDLIADLDRATPQVEIEARIVVTSRDFQREIGIQWGFNQENSPRYGNTTNLAFPNSIVLNGNGVPSDLGIAADQNGQSPAAGIGAQGRGYAVNLPTSTFNTGVGISLGNILGNFSLDAALTALERQGRGRLISTPKVTTQNNQEAVIRQGQQIPIQTVANNTVTVTFKDAVLTLKVTPQITDAGTVILSLEVNNDSADFSRQINGIPPINTQQAKTQVLVRDGATAVIGGIYQSNETTNQSRTPFLGELPLLGYLFRNKATNTRNQELLLFITPRIVKS
jgi:type IV pilus assembly protein PilQ